MFVQFITKTAEFFLVRGANEQSVIIGIIDVALFIKKNMAVALRMESCFGLIMWLIYLKN